VAPSNQTVPVNTIASFFCRAWGLNARWYINNTLVDTDNQETYERIGFTFTKESIPSQDRNHVFNLNMTVTASAAINTTNFSCLAYLDPPALRTPAYLSVMGKSCLSWCLQVTVLMQTTLFFLCAVSDLFLFNRHLRCWCSVGSFVKQIWAKDCIWCDTITNLEQTACYTIWRPYMWQ